MQTFAAVPQLSSSLSKRRRTVLFHHRKKSPKSVRTSWQQRSRKRLGIRRNIIRSSARSFERSVEFSVKVFLKTRDSRVEAQNLRCKAVLSAKFLCPCNPPLPLVRHPGAIRNAAIRNRPVRNGAIRHAAIISPPSRPRNTTQLYCKNRSCGDGACPVSPQQAKSSRAIAPRAGCGETGAQPVNLIFRSRQRQSSGRPRCSTSRVKIARRRPERSHETCDAKCGTGDTGLAGTDLCG